jgi:Fe-S cluster biogenesis protein NfuA
MKDRMQDEILTVIKEVLAPMVAADGGRLYVIQADSKQVSLHLAGRFSGCPGNQVTARRVIQPVIAAVAPNAELMVTWGRLVPTGALRVDDSEVASAPAE